MVVAASIDSTVRGSVLAKTRLTEEGYRKFLDSIVFQLVDVVTGDPNGYTALIGGVMFGGKSYVLSRLISALRDYDGIELQVVKSSTGSKRDGRVISSRALPEQPQECDLVIPDDRPEEAYEHSNTNGGRVVRIFDEIHFFTPELVDVFNYGKRRGEFMIAAGLEYDFTHNPFGPALDLRGGADFVYTLSARCNVDPCAKLATRNQITNNDGSIPRVVYFPKASRVCIEGQGTQVEDDRKREYDYEPRCRPCHEIPLVREI